MESVWIFVALPSLLKTRIRTNDVLTRFFGPQIVFKIIWWKLTDNNYFDIRPGREKVYLVQGYVHL